MIPSTDISPSTRLFLAEMHRLFDEQNAKWDRRFADLAVAQEQRNASDEPRVGTLVAKQHVVADNWGGLFEQPAHIPEEFVSNLSGLDTTPAPSSASATLTLAPSAATPVTQRVCEFYEPKIAQEAERSRAFIARNEQERHATVIRAEHLLTNTSDVAAAAALEIDAAADDMAIPMHAKCSTECLAIVSVLASASSSTPAVPASSATLFKAGLSGYLLRLRVRPDRARLRRQSRRPAVPCPRAARLCRARMVVHMAACPRLSTNRAWWNTGAKLFLVPATSMAAGRTASAATTFTSPANAGQTVGDAPSPATPFSATPTMEEEPATAAPTTYSTFELSVNANTSQVAASISLTRVVFIDFAALVGPLKWCSTADDHYGTFESMDFAYLLLPANCFLKYYEHSTKAMDSQRVMRFEIQLQNSVHYDILSFAKAVTGSSWFEQAQLTVEFLLEASLWLVLNKRHALFKLPPMLYLSLDNETHKNLQHDVDIMQWKPPWIYLLPEVSVVPSIWPQPLYHKIGVGNFFQTLDERLPEHGKLADLMLHEYFAVIIMKSSSHVTNMWPSAQYGFHVRISIPRVRFWPDKDSSVIKCYLHILCLNWDSVPDRATHIQLQFLPLQHTYSNLRAAMQLKILWSSTYTRMVFLHDASWLVACQRSICISCNFMLMRGSESMFCQFVTGSMGQISVDDFPLDLKVSFLHTQWDSSSTMQMKIFSWILHRVDTWLWRGHTKYYERCSSLSLVFKETQQISLAHMLGLSSIENEVLQQVVLGVEQHMLFRPRTYLYIMASSRSGAVEGTQHSSAQQQHAWMESLLLSDYELIQDHVDLIVTNFLCYMRWVLCIFSLAQHQGDVFGQQITRTLFSPFATLGMKKVLVSHLYLHTIFVWDPGGSELLHRLGGKPKLKKRGMSGTTHACAIIWAMGLGLVEPLPRHRLQEERGSC